ncbi:M14 family metallopeptidase [Algihabitans albus]|uniref:succinylglutamate desuccinylase/aspartoacylase domain-containing protein n=1 Tax=Algihabitans albus TaxID=2164067 RepID=UPI000E5C993F|nr:succinylglutamate desuccinylase/aspartoacylase family protein [Algihabitans albus]
MPQTIENPYPIELAPPDIGRWRDSNTNLDWIWRFRADRPGPHLLVSAVVHGNELCGAIALDRLLAAGLRPKRGTLTLAFMNVEAYLSFDAEDPFASRWVEEDFNRLWDPETLEGPRDSADLRRARAVRPVVDAADHLLDIHSMQQPSAPVALAGMAEKNVALAQGLGVPQVIVRDRGHAAGRRLRDYGRFDDPASPTSSLLIECGQHWEAAAADLALDCTLRFLRHFDAVEAEAIAALAPLEAAAEQKVLEISGPVTIRSDDFRFVEDFTGLETISKAGTVIAYDGEEPVTTPYDDCVLLMPTRRLWKGQTAVRLGRYS